MQPLNGLVKDAGANFACLVVNGKVGDSTFPPAMQGTISAAARVFLQLFLSASTIQRSYQELYISFEYYGLTALRLSPTVTVLVCSSPTPDIEKIKAAIVAHQQALLAAVGAEALVDAFDLSEVSQPNKAQGSAAKQAAMVEQTLAQAAAQPAAMAFDDQAITGLQKALAEHVGPAAKVLWARAYKAWQDTGETPAGLDVMLDNLASYIDQPEAKVAFVEHAKSILNP